MMTFEEVTMRLVIQCDGFFFMFCNSNEKKINTVAIHQRMEDTIGTKKKK